MGPWQRQLLSGQRHSSDEADSAGGGAEEGDRGKGRGRREGPRERKVGGAKGGAGGGGRGKGRKEEEHKDVTQSILCQAVYY